MAVLTQNLCKNLFKFRNKGICIWQNYKMKMLIKHQIPKSSLYCMQWLTVYCLKASALKDFAMVSKLCSLHMENFVPQRPRRR